MEQPTNNQNLPNTPGSDQLREALKGLTTNQIRFCIARIDSKTDKEAAETIGISPGSVKQWDNKAQVDEVVSLMRYDGMITALEIRRRSLAKAMAVKAAGLEDDNPKIRQDAATEIIEWELGKATQRQETRLSGEVQFVWDHKPSA